jgi:nitrite reductase (NO-forming)
MVRSCTLFATVSLLTTLLGCGNRHETRGIAASPEALDPVQGQELAEMASAPNVPPPITRSFPTRVILNIEIKEHTKEISDGVSYTYWTFGDETPGKFLRVREGDLVETHLSNHPDNSLAHNIDFHGATGPGGGGEASFVAPGHTTTFTWRALRPGLFLYHCVAPPAGLHIANGMYGLILVEPKGGLPPVDKEFYIAQGEFYTSGKYGARGPQTFSLDKALREQPDYVVFNGKVGALMGDNALKANVGESVRIYLGNAGPALVSSFHIVGEIFDSVYSEGGILPNQHNVQTTVIPVGGSSMVEFTATVPGEYTLVDHSMFRAFNKGAMGQLRVTGKENDMIFSGRTNEEVFAPGTHLQKLMAKSEPVAEGAVLTKEDLMQRGQQVFSTVCFACHQSNGQGLPNTFPPLAGSDFLMADKDRSIRIVLSGLKGEVTVNGDKFHGEMPKPPLSDDQVAGVLTFVRNSFGNSGPPVTLADVLRVKHDLEASGTLPTQQVISRTEEE